MIEIILLLVFLVVGLTLILKRGVAPNYGEDVEGRFIERLNYIPSQKPKLLSRESLHLWLGDAGNSKAKSGYVFPVIFPFDVLFLVSLGLLLGVASVWLANRTVFLSNVPNWIWWLFPALYAVSDLAEDCVIAALFKSVVPLNDGTFFVLRRLTSLKIATVSIAIGQAGFLGVLHALCSFFRHIRVSVSCLRACAMVAASLTAIQGQGVAAEPRKPDALPPQEVIDAVFPQGPAVPPLVIALKRPDGAKPDARCGLAPAELIESCGAKVRTFNILMTSPEGDPPVPSEIFWKVSRFTVDVDGSARAYHPADPLGVGICGPKSQVCALDELPNADIRLFRGTEEIDPHRSEDDRADYLATWAKAWSLIIAKPDSSLGHQADPRIPEEYALYYLKDDDLTVVFKTPIIPFKNGSPCVWGPKSANPGYFVAATSFSKTKPTPETACQPNRYIDSSEVPFVVLPGDVFGKLNTGDLAIGFAQSKSGDRLVFGVVGDTGPFYETAEGSIVFNSKMLRRNKHLENSTEQKDIDIELGTDDITAMAVLVLGGTATAFKGDFSAKNIAAVGEILLKRWNMGRSSTERLVDCMNAAPLNSWR